LRKANPMCHLAGPSPRPATLTREGLKPRRMKKREKRQVAVPLRQGSALPKAQGQRRKVTKRLNLKVRKGREKKKRGN